MKRSPRHVYRSIRSRLYGHFDCDTDIIAFHAYRAVYFALPKVANSSLKQTLGPLIPEMQSAFQDRPDDGFATPFSDPAMRTFLRRRHILLCKHELRRVRGYRSFAFVRNPWDRLVSCYTQKVAGRTFSDGPEARGTTRTLARAGYFRDEMSFEDFVHAVANIPDAKANRHFRSQTAFLTGKDGRLLVNDIGRFEDLERELARIASDVGFHGVSLPHLKQTARRDYREYYTDATAQIVSRRYRANIKNFGYEFSR